MLSSPVRRGTPVAAFTVGLIAGSLLRAPLPGPVRWWLVGGAVVAVLLVEWRVVAVRVPQNRRLVPESVFRFGRHLGPLQFGLEMGTGARTYLPSALPYAPATAVLLLASLPAALAAGGGFGLGRALMTVAALRYGGDAGREWAAEWTRHARPLAALLAAVLVAGLVPAALAAAG